MQSSPHHAWSILGLLSGALLVIAFSMFMIPLSASSMSVSRLSSAEVLALVGSAQWVGAIAATVATPRLILRLGASRVCTMGPACSALALICFSWPAPVTLILGGLLIGFAIGPEIPASAEVLRQRLVLGLQTRALSTKQAAMPLGAILAGAVIPTFIDYVGFQLAFLICAAIAAAYACVMHITLPDKRQDVVRLKTTNPGHNMLRTILQRRLRGTLLISAMCALSLATVNTFLVLLLTQEHTLSVQTAGMALAAAQSGALLGRLSAAALGGRGSRERDVFIWSSAVTTVGLLMLIGEPELWPLLVASALLGAGVSSNSATLVVMAQRYAPEAGPGAAVSAAMFCNFVACSLGPVVFVQTQKSIGIAASFAIFVAIGAAASLAAGVSYRPRCIHD